MFRETGRIYAAQTTEKVSNVMDVWEYDLLYVQACAKYNDNYRYILAVIDVYSKYLHLIPIRTKNGPLRFGAYSITLNIRQDVSLYGYAPIRARNF